MSASDIIEGIVALRAGRVSLNELAGRFRQRDWIIARREPPDTRAERAARYDPPPDVPGSVDEVTGAYNDGMLSQEEYDVLCAAIADAIIAGRIAAGPQAPAAAGSGGPGSPAGGARR